MTKESPLAAHSSGPQSDPTASDQAPSDQAVSDPAPLVDALAQTAFVVTAVLTRIAGAYDLSLTQLRVLGILRDRRLRMSDLAGYLGLDKSTLSGLVDRAEKRDLLARGKDGDDRRAVTVFMTPAGLELAQQVGAEVRAALAPVTAPLQPGQQADLAHLLATMLQAGPPARATTS